MTDWKLIKRAMDCDAVKLTLPNWTNAYIFFDGQNWKNESRCNLSCFSLHENWIEYKEPKNKVKKWLWAEGSRNGKSHKIAFSGEFATEKQAEIILNPHKVTKIEGSMIEVDE